MVHQGPILMNHRKKFIHGVRNVLKVRWKMISDVYRLFAVAAPKLRDVCYRSVVQDPESIFVESLNPLLETDLNAIGK